MTELLQIHLTFIDCPYGFVLSEVCALRMAPRCHPLRPVRLYDYLHGSEGD